MPVPRTALATIIAAASLASYTLHGAPDQAPPAAHLAEIEKFAADIVEAMSDPEVVDDEHAPTFTPNPDAFRLAVRPDGKPLVIAHRGASGYLPEHTLAAYSAAYFMGADVIEPDVVLTKDGVPICSHDITLDETTDVAEKFPGRARDDGKHYAIDFTLAEIKTLEKLGREGRVRMPGHTVPTLSEMIEMVQGLNEERVRRFGGDGRWIDGLLIENGQGPIENIERYSPDPKRFIGSVYEARTVGIIPEIKQPYFHEKEGTTIAQTVLDVLNAHGYVSRGAPCAIQCFELKTLRSIRTDLKSDLSLVFLSDKALSVNSIDCIRESCDAVGLRCGRPENGHTR